MTALLRKWKICIFGGFYFKMKNADILNFQLIKYLRKGLSYLKNCVIGVNHCGICCFISLKPNKHKKITDNNNWTIQIWKLLSTEMSDKFFGRHTAKWRNLKNCVKMNGNHFLMANIVKLNKYHIFDLMKTHNRSKIWFTNNKLSLWKGLVYD